jgi:hypothetical protein
MPAAAVAARHTSQWERYVFPVEKKQTDRGNKNLAASA